MKRVWLGENDYHAERLTDPAALLRGTSESVLFGKPVRLAVSWPDGTPDGRSETEMAHVADMMDAERGRLSRESEPAPA
jgi:hypothetical protein